MPEPTASRTAPSTLIATLFGIGFLKPGPGTWGSLTTILLWWGLTRIIESRFQVAAAIVIAVLAIAIGIPAATRVAITYNKKDPQFVVIDEVAGQIITLIGAPATWKYFLLGFILFRGLDMLKPPPIRQLERLPQGSGIVLDDVAAGLFALALMQLTLHFGWLSR
jgi:phosphatidylglycerophosphatase A